MDNRDFAAQQQRLTLLMGAVFAAHPDADIQWADMTPTGVNMRFITDERVVLDGIEHVTMTWYRATDWHGNVTIGLVRRERYQHDALPDAASGDYRPVLHV